MKKSISDDDLCSGCSACVYRPGNLSDCTLNWPGTIDASGDREGYVTNCDSFVQSGEDCDWLLPRSKPNYDLTSKQKAFVAHAEREGYDIDYYYSGRGMFGQHCPAVRLKRDQVGEFGHKGASRDSLGMGEVIYCR
jgi:hypothetical protein